MFHRSLSHQKQINTLTNQWFNADFCVMLRMLLLVLVFKAYSVCYSNALHMLSCNTHQNLPKLTTSSICAVDYFGICWHPLPSIKTIKYLDGSNNRISKLGIISRILERNIPGVGHGGPHDNEYTVFLWYVHDAWGGLLRQDGLRDNKKFITVLSEQDSCILHPC